MKSEISAHSDAVRDSAERGNVLFKVYGKNGKLIEAAAYMPQEAEVLFKSGTRFKVLKMFSTDHPVDISKKILQITLKEI